MTRGKAGPKVRLAPSYTPHACAVLAVDTAERSGWAVFLRGELLAHGEIDVLTCPDDMLEKICRMAVGTGPEAALVPGVLVFERPFRGTTQGQHIGTWQRAWLKAGGRDKRMLGVYPSTWRARVTGKACATRELARAAERTRAQREIATVRRLPDWTKVEVGPDAAAAVCIGLWAIRAGEVAKLLPKPRAPRAPKTERLGCLSPHKPRKPKAVAAQAEVV